MDLLGIACRLFILDIVYLSSTYVFSFKQANNISNTQYFSVHVCPVLLLLLPCFKSRSLQFLFLEVLFFILTHRHLRELDLQENDIEDHRGNWLSCFPDTCTSLVRLNFACLEGEVNAGALERLVGRCPNLKSLRLNRSVPLEVLYRILLRAPQLVDLGTGGNSQEPRTVRSANIANAFLKCKSLRSLSGFWEVAPSYLHLVSLCAGLTSLNLSYATIPSNDLIKLVRHCPKLQRLWVCFFTA